MTTLRRTLGLTDLVLIVVGTVIGSGIFRVPSAVLQQTGGSVGLSLLVWFAAGILSLLGALTFAEMGAAKPDAGGLYVFIRDALGPLPAFLYGWTMFLVIASGSAATLAVAFKDYLGAFVTLPPLAGKGVAIAMIAVVMVINVRGARQGANVQGVATAIKVLAIVVMSACLLIFGHGSSGPAGFWPAQWNVSLLTGVGLAMISVLWAYEGWQYVTFSAGETKDPQRVFPRAIVVATFALIILYVVANIGKIAALGPAGAARSDHVAADASRTVLGSASGILLSALVLVSIFSAANGLMMTAPRLYYSMARDGVFFARLAKVNERFGTPAAAIVLLAVWSAVLAI